MNSDGSNQSAIPLLFVSDQSRCGHVTSSRQWKSRDRRKSRDRVLGKLSSLIKERATKADPFLYHRSLLPTWHFILLKDYE